MPNHHGIEPIHRGRSGTRPSRTGWKVGALLSLLILFHLGNNWLWRTNNQVVYGFDRMYHQVTSLAYYDILRQGVTARNLFAALTWSDYYPPLVHLIAAAFYGVFGVSMDVAALSNSLYLVALLLAVYAVGRRLGGPWVGLLAAFIVSMLPIVFSMSRYLYIDFALTAFVAVNISLLLASERFRRKGISLLYGLSLGLGLLTKWTFAAFVAAPLLAALASRDLWRDVGRVLHPASWQRGRLLAAGLLGLALTALWFLPNVQATAALPLGYALVPLSWLIWSATLYFALGDGADRGGNLLAALGLGLALASAWYLTKINFLEGFWLNAYGKPTGRSWGFSRYLEFLFREHFSPLMIGVLLLALAGLAWRRWQRTGSLRSFLALGLDGWALALWAVVPFVIFSSRVSIVHSRYIMPLLPPLGLVIALWLGQVVRPRRLRAVLIGAVCVFLLFQFAALSFDALDGWQAQVPLLARGLSIQLPSSGRTDSGYWVAPDVLQYATDHRDRDPARLGILVNEPQVNSKHFIYLTYAEYPHVHVNELATLGRAQPAYPRLFEQDFVLLLDPAPDYPRRPDTVETTERLLSQPDDTFHRAFEWATAYPLPDGRQLRLYRRRYPPQEDNLNDYQSLMADLGAAARSGDILLAMPPQQVYALARYGDGSLPIYPLDRAWPAELDALTGQASRLWLALGPDAPEGDILLRWLAEHAYRAADAWYGPVQLFLYGPADKAGGRQQPTEVSWENGITLTGVRFVDSTVQPGDVLRLDLTWQSKGATVERYKIFLHLLDAGGRVVAQRDSEPLDGLRPTTTWTAGEVLTDRYGLLLPTDLPDGEYRLVLGIYDAASGRRALACCPQSDAVPLAYLRVEGKQIFILSEKDGHDGSP